MGAHGPYVVTAGRLLADTETQCLACGPIRVPGSGLLIDLPISPERDAMDNTSAHPEISTGPAALYDQAPCGLLALDADVSGLPAVSLPLHWSAEGLPVGVQLVATKFREDRLLTAGEVIEQAARFSALEHLLTR